MRSRTFNVTLLITIILIAFFFINSCSSGSGSGSAGTEPTVSPTGSPTVTPTTSPTISPTPSPTSSPGQFAKIYVYIHMHNEEPLEGIYPDFVNNEEEFKKHRAVLLPFVNMLKEENVMFNYQSDWNFLQAIAAFDSGEGTGGKNILKYIKDLGFEVDPHAHETSYNYADVAYLINQLGVPTSNTVGGFIAIPPEDSKIEYFQDPITGWNYDYTWQAEILWGAGSYHHTNDPFVSGVWCPKDNDNFYEHDPTKLPHIGGYNLGHKGVELLLEKSLSGELDPEKIYTIDIPLGQMNLLGGGFIEDQRRQIKNLKEMDTNGLLQWVGMKQVIEIWQQEYGSQPNLLLYTDE